MGYENYYKLKIIGEVMLGGDSDTVAAIAGSIAEPFYKYIPEWLEKITVERMTDEMRIIYKEFNEKYK